MSTWLDRRIRICAGSVIETMEDIARSETSMMSCRNRARRWASTVDGTELFEVAGIWSRGKRNEIADKLVEACMANNGVLRRRTIIETFNEAKVQEPRLN